MNTKHHDIVFINYLVVDAIIGIYEHERTIKQPIALNIEMEWNNQKASETDDLKYTLDYEKISNEIKAYIGASAFLLVEKLAESLAQHLLLTFSIPSIQIELHKLTAIKGTHSVGVKIFRAHPTLHQ